MSIQEKTRSVLFSSGLRSAMLGGLSVAWNAPICHGVTDEYKGCEYARGMENVCGSCARTCKTRLGRGVMNLAAFSKLDWK